MSQRFVYEDSQYGWAVILGDQVARLGDYGGYSLKAYAGDIGQSTFVIDDPNANVGHNGDAILGLQNFYVLELDCPTVGSNGIYGQRLYTGFTREREYRRGDAGRSSLVVGASRQISVTLEDLNARLSFRILQGATAQRPAETDVARITWLLAHPALSNVYNDAGWFDTSNPVNMDANDYSGQTAADILHDCAVKSGKNYWVGFWEATSKACLWYGDSNTSTTYTSPLAISNVLADIDNVTTFAPEPDATLNRNPARTFAGLYYTHDGGSGYVYNATTASNYAYRDGSVSNANNHTAATALAEANRELTDAASETDTISCRVKLPSSKATGIKKGQRVQCKFSHLPGYESWTWLRVNSLQIAQDEPTDQRYTLGLELTPQTAEASASKYLIALVTGGTNIGSTFNTSSSAYPWTAAYNPGNFAFPVQTVACGAGPPEQQGFGLFYRAIHPGESGTNVLTVATSGPSTGQSVWVWEVDGVDPSTITVVSAGMEVIGANASVTLSGSASVPSVLIGGIAWGKVNYDSGWCAGGYETNAVVTTVAGTPLLGANGVSAANNCSAGPPWLWGAYATGTGTLSLTANANDQGGGAYACGFPTAHAAILMPTPGTFSIVQSVFQTTTGTANVVNLPSPP